MKGRLQPPTHSMSLSDIISMVGVLMVEACCLCTSQQGHHAAARGVSRLHFGWRTAGGSSAMCS